MFNPQLNRYGELTHLLTTEGLPRRILEQILDAAQAEIPALTPNSCVPAMATLDGARVFNLFCEPASQTQLSFAQAARRLAADVIDVKWAGGSLLDTVEQLPATEKDFLVLRHGASGALHTVLAHQASRAHLINAGDGRHAHPTQALIDMLRIRHIKRDFTTLTVTLVGDMLHSGLARSTIHALTTLGAPELRVVAPLALLPEGLPQLGVRACSGVDEALTDADVIILLHPRRALEGPGRLPSKDEYFRDYALTAARLAHARPDVMVLHAGSMDTGVAADMPLMWGEPQSVFAVALRQAVMRLLAGAQG